MAADKTVRVRMLVSISGTRDGDKWPARGETVVLPAGEGLQLVAQGDAELVRGSKTETADADPAPERAVIRASLSTADMPAGKKRSRPQRGPGGKFLKGG